MAKHQSSGVRFSPQSRPTESRGRRRSSIGTSWFWRRFRRTGRPSLEKTPRKKAQNDAVTGMSPATPTLHARQGEELVSGSGSPRTTVHAIREDSSRHSLPPQSNSNSRNVGADVLLREWSTPKAMVRRRDDTRPAVVEWDTAADDKQMGSSVPAHILGRVDSTIVMNEDASSKADPRTHRDNTRADIVVERDSTVDDDPMDVSVLDHILGVGESTIAWNEDATTRLTELDGEYIAAIGIDSPITAPKEYSASDSSDISSSKSIASSSTILSQSSSRKTSICIEREDGNKENQHLLPLSQTGAQSLDFSPDPVIDPAVDPLVNFSPIIALEPRSSSGISSDPLTGTGASQPTQAVGRETLSLNSGVPLVPPSSDIFNVGQAVMIVSRVDNGQRGWLVRRVRKGTYTVEIGENGGNGGTQRSKTLNKRWTSLALLPNPLRGIGPTDPNPVPVSYPEEPLVLEAPSIPCTTPMAPTSDIFDVGQEVMIVSRADKGQQGRIVRRVQKGMYAVHSKDGSTIVNKRWMSLALLQAHDGAPSSSTGEEVSCQADRSPVQAAPATLPENRSIHPQTDNSVHVVSEQPQQYATALYPRSISRGPIQETGTEELEEPRFLAIPSILGTTSVAPTMDTFNVGQFVLIVSRADGGQQGRIVRRVQKGMYAVQSRDGSKIVNKRWKSLALISSHHAAPSISATGMSSEPPQDTPPTPTDGAGVPTADHIPSLHTAAPVASTSAPSRRGNKRRSPSLPRQMFTAGANPGESCWKVEGSDSGGLFFGSRRIVKFRVANGPKRKDVSLLSHRFGDLLLIVETPVNEFELKKPIDATVEHNNRTYELVSTKIKADGNDGGGQMYFKPKKVESTFLAVSGPEIPTRSLTKELLDIADFSGLAPRKVMARLDLLQSPVYLFPNKKPAIFFMDESNFTSVPDIGNVGCGFISEDYVLHLLQQKEITGFSVKSAQKKSAAVLGLQVRVFIPTIGVIKGMLAVKQITSNEKPIQIFSSMLKVGPSKQLRVQEGACLLVTKNGFHTNSKVNHYIGRMLDPNLKDPPVKSFNVALKKKISDMIVRLWTALNVPLVVCESYVQNSTRPRCREHAWLIGLADPTGSLPAGSIFMTGMKHQHIAGDQLFVTRSPCTQPKHGRSLPVVTSKPPKMSESDWNWLNDRPFGGIYFAFPKEGMMSLPEHVATGDLDGDLYFVCWNAEILGHLNTVPIHDIPNVEKSRAIQPSTTTESSAGESSDWFYKARDLSLDIKAELDMWQLKGKLYTLLEKSAEEFSLAHPDAVSFSEAFDRALEFRTHGKPIELPPHLYNMIPESLQRHITCVPRTA